MHIQLQNGKMLNTYYVNNIKQNFKDRNKVVIELTNGTYITEGSYSSEEEAEKRVTELRSQLLGK